MGVDVDPNVRPALEKRECARLSWSSHPLADAPGRGLLGIAVMAITVFGVYATTQSLGWALLGLLALCVAVTDYWLPTRYDLDADGVTVSLLIWRRRRAWRDLRSFKGDQRGVFVSPFVGPSRLDPFRGLYLRYAGNRDEVLGLVRSRLERGS